MISISNNSNSKPKWRLDDVAFIDAWNRSANSLEAARAAGMTPNQAKCRAYFLRTKGYQLKAMPSGKRLFVRLPLDDDAPRDPCEKPTGYAPGSEGKIEVLAARAMAGEELWHPDDIEESDVG
jgi:hypothetical protein